jgi:hypothetical protein
MGIEITENHLSKCSLFGRKHLTLETIHRFSVNKMMWIFSLMSPIPRILLIVEFRNLDQNSVICLDCP